MHDQWQCRRAHDENNSAGSCPVWRRARCQHVYVSCRSPLASEGFAVEDAKVWGLDGRVLAVARQTRLAIV